MASTWYKIFNETEFNDLGLTSKKYTLDLEGLGQKEILVTKGDDLGILYEDIFLIVNLNDANPFEFEGHSVYKKENGDVYLGIENES